MSVFPACMCGAISSSYNLACIVSGVRIMITSAVPAASDTGSTVRPASSAFAQLRDPL